MLRLLNQRLRRLYSRLRRRSPKTKIAIRRLGLPAAKIHQNGAAAAASAAGAGDSQPKTIRIATFNAAMFSMAPAVPNAGYSNSGVGFRNEDDDYLNPSSKKRLEFDIGAKLANDRPRSILKRSPSCSYPAAKSAESLSRQGSRGKSKLRVSINLPDNEISLERTRQLNFAGAVEDDEAGPSTTPKPNRQHRKGKASLRLSWSFPARPAVDGDEGGGRWRNNDRTVFEVLKQVEADMMSSCCQLISSITAFAYLPEAIR